MKKGTFVSTPLALQSINLDEIRLPKTFAALSIQPNLVTTAFKIILEISNVIPVVFRCIFWHGQIVSDQVQVIFLILTYFLVQICKK